MSVKGSGRLLQGRDRQGLGRAQPQVVGVTANRPMSAPGGPRQALDLAMSGQTTLCARHPRNEDCVANQANQADESGSRASRPCLGQITT